jgi:hypothetical protein
VVATASVRYSFIWKGIESSRSQVTLKAPPAMDIFAPKEVPLRNYFIILID